MKIDSIQNSKIGKTIQRLNLGKYKAWYQRVVLYVTAVNFLMIFYGFTLNNKWMPWYGWLATITISVVVILLIDILFIWESEQDTTATKNPKIMQIIDTQTRLEHKVDTILLLLGDDDEDEEETVCDVPPVPETPYDVIRDETRLFYPTSGTDSYIAHGATIT